MDVATDAGHSVALLLAAALGFAGCVTKDRDSYEAAQAAHEACLADETQTAEDCAPLEAEPRVRGSRYQDNAQRAWGCGKPPEECKPPHGP